MIDVEVLGGRMRRAFEDRDTIGILNGGTGARDAATARLNLGALSAADSPLITGIPWFKASPTSAQIEAALQFFAPPLYDHWSLLESGASVTTATWAMPDIAANGNIVPSIAPVNLAAQTGAITTTTMVAALAGVYRISAVATCTTISGAGSPTLDVTIGWTDENGAQTSKIVSALSLSANGYASGTLVVYSTASNVTYATSIAGAAGSPQYSLRLRAEPI